MESSDYKKSGTKYSMTKLRRLEKKAGEKRTLSKTIEQAKQELKKAESTYKEKKKVAESLRDMFMERRAKELAKEKDMSEWSIHKQIREREKT